MQSDDANPPTAQGGERALERLAAALHESNHPTHLGPFHVVELIGEGGMGSVYKAEQRAPIQRTVAIKIIKPGMSSRDVIARFEAERQALAMMEHPNVAHVIDAGTTDDGRPYFVMEFVRGEPITAYCDRRSLSLEQRLTLFTQACAAVQHAHQKAIIHRDLKPSNILVAEQNGAPCVKVIDFGVAKALHDRLTDKTLVTEMGSLIGTLEYMSPEQADARSHDIDTRSDVYSLGVVLYELLTGTVPFDAATLRTAGYREIQRIICSVDPPRPSTRLSELQHQAAQIAGARRLGLDELQRKLKSELDWIPLKAMRKVPAERYATATELADDIANYLARRPLRAGPESGLYRARKFLSRNKRGVFAAAAMILLLFSGIVATSWQAIRATRAERDVRIALTKAEDANANTRAVNDFLTQDVLWSAEPLYTRGRELSIREVLDNAARDVGIRFKDRPRTEAAIRNTLAGAYRTLGQRDTALSHSTVAMEIVQKQNFAAEPDGIQIRNDYAMILHEMGKSAQAEVIFRSTLADRRRTLGNTDALTVESVGNLAASLLAQRKTEEAAPLLAEEQAIAKQVFSDERVSHALERVASMLAQQGKLEEAELVYRDAVSTSRRVSGDDHPATIDLVAAFAALLGDRGKLEESGALAGEVVERSRRILGREHPKTILRINFLARAQMLLGRFEQADPLFREALELSRSVNGVEAPETLAIATNYAFILTRQRKFELAEPLLRETLAIQRRVLGEDHTTTIASINNLGGLLSDQNQHAAAEPLFRQAWEARRSALGESHVDTLGALSNVSRAIRSQDRHAEAEPLFADLYRLTADSLVPPRQAALFMSHWGPCLVQLGRFAEAEAPLLEARSRLTATGQTDGEHMRRVLQALTAVYAKSERSEQAAECLAALAAITPATTRPN